MLRKKYKSRISMVELRAQPIKYKTFRTIKIGDRVGTLTVRELQQTEPTGYWCLCTCGQEKLYWLSELRRGMKGARCTCKLPVPRGTLAARRFSKFGIIWECSCGKFIDLPSNSKQKSCGCDTPISRAVKTLYRRYKDGAKERDLIFELTLPEFEKLITSNCHYTGTQPANNLNGLLWHGIDRMNNAEGYTVENSVPCDSNINRAKGTMGYLEFKDWLAKIGVDGGG